MYNFSGFPLTRLSFHLVYFPLDFVFFWFFPCVAITCCIFIGLPFATSLPCWQSYLLFFLDLHILLLLSPLYQQQIVQWFCEVHLIMHLPTYSVVLAQCIFTWLVRCFPIVQRHWVCIWCSGCMLQLPHSLLPFFFSSIHCMSSLCLFFWQILLYLPSDCLSSPFGRNINSLFFWFYSIFCYSPLMPNLNY
jgi:hypothetical protein